MFSIGFIAPYSHIVFNKSGVEGIFGFSLMSSFLFAVGFPVFCLSLSYLLHKASYYVPKIIKGSYKAFSTLTAFTGFYFIVWAVNPYVSKDFHPAFYYGSMIIISLSLIKAVRMIEVNSEKLREKIRYLMHVIVIKIRDNGHVKDDDQYKEDIIIPSIYKVNED